MKKYLRSGVLAIMLMSQGLVFAQDETSNTSTPPPGWMPEKGYWIVESNINVPQQYIVSFYNEDQVMVYKEEVKGFTLKVERSAVKMHLKRVLETAIAAWTRERRAKENEGWVANNLR